jgi:hypothetical protein
MLPAVGDLAGKISTTNFVPKGLRGKPAEIAACILTGREVGIGPMESLSKIHVIDGRPAMSSELMRSLVMRDGHEITYAVLTEDKVTAKGRRAGSQEWTEVTWTMKDAQRIGVAGRDTWKKYPRQMLRKGDERTVPVVVSRRIRRHFLHAGRTGRGPRRTAPNRCEAF